MSLKSVHQNILKIKETKSTNAKISLLSEMLSNSEDFKRVIVLMYDDFKHFKVNKLPKKNIEKRAVLEVCAPTEIPSDEILLVK